MTKYLTKCYNNYVKEKTLKPINKEIHIEKSEYTDSYTVCIKHPKLYYLYNNGDITIYYKSFIKTVVTSPQTAETQKRGIVMKENKNTLMSVIANTALTAVATARVEECATLTTNEAALKAVSAYAQLDVFDTKYNIKKCEILSIVAHELKEEKSLTFKKMCEIFNIDNSNASKMVTIWDNYYSNDRELKGGYHFTDYSVSQLAPFASKQVTSVEKLFTEYEVSPKTAVSRMREFAKWINKNGIDHWNEIIDIINGVVKNGDVTTKTETEKETETETETETKTKKTETEKKPIELKDKDMVIINGYLYHVCAVGNNEPFLVSEDKKAE